MFNKWLFCLLIFQSIAFASKQGSITLTGSVEGIVEIGISPSPMSTKLNLLTSSSNQLIAQASEYSNSNRGYEIIVTSTNRGKLVHSNGAAEVAYRLNYGGEDLDLSRARVKAKDVRAGGIYQENSNVSISYSGDNAEVLPSGQYSDTVIFTIKAK